MKNQLHRLAGIFVICIAYIASGLSVNAATKIYNGSNTYSSNILYTWDGKHLYQGANTYSSKILLTVDGTFPPILFTIL